jgi:hypothetical protein
MPTLAQMRTLVDNWLYDWLLSPYRPVVVA